MIPQSKPWLGDDELRQLSECIANDWITSGAKVREFEQRIAELCQTKRAVSCTSGTVALFLALKSLDVGVGDEVIIPDFTFIATANAVVLTGATPVFVDIDARTLNIDPERIADAITKRTKVIMPVHLYGQSADMSAISRLTTYHKLFVVEDNAQGIGVGWDGKPTGGFGAASCLSFYADKTLTTGEGGMVLTDDDSLADKCIRLTCQGNLDKGRYIHDTIGFNFRMTDLQAAVGLAQLTKLARAIKRRRLYDRIYRGALGDIVEFPVIDSRCYNVPFRTVVLVDDPEALRKYLLANGVDARRVFYPLHVQPCYRRDGNYPNSVRAYERGLALPLFSTLTENEIEYICATIWRFYGD